MNYAIAQELMQLEEESIDYAVTSVKPLETEVKQNTEHFETELQFPATVKAVSEALTRTGLKCNPNTLKGRWMNERILPVFEGLDVPEIKTEKGLITVFGYSAITEVISRCIQGDRGQKIAPEVLREELIERYGSKPVENTLQDAKDLLAKTQQIKQDSDDQKATIALAKVEAKSQLNILEEAVRTLAAASNDEEEAYELSEEEKARIAKRFLAKKVAEQEYLQKLARGEV